MELEINKTYSTTELIQALQISKPTWDRRRQDYLDNLALYYEYEITTKGRSVNYHIIQKLGDYQPPLRKNAKEKSNADYVKEIAEVVRQDNLQTAANVSRLIKCKEDIQQYHHSETTLCEYTRQHMNEMYGNDVGKSGTHGYIISYNWCRFYKDKNKYEPMTQEQYEDFRHMFGANQAACDKQLNAWSGYMSGDLTRAERNEIVIDAQENIFLETINAFYAKYGCYPVRAKMISQAS